MKLHKIALIEYKGKLESVALTNRSGFEEEKYFGFGLIPISKMDSYYNEATRYTKEVKNIYDLFLNKDINEAISYCKKNELEYSNVEG